MKIEKVDAYQIFDSRGMPTLEVEVILANGIRGRGLVPSGASTGQFEAIELRDNNMQVYRGKSVNQAIEHVRTEISDALIGFEVGDQAGIDQRIIQLDGTPNKSRLGANAILGVSMACAQASAQEQAVPLYKSLGRGKGNLLPLPEIQIIGGGAHANWRTDIQDYLIIATGAGSYSETLEMTFNVYHAAGELLRERNQYYGIADEGGYWPEFDSNEVVFELLIEAIERAGYAPGREICIALDIAASDLYDADSQTYHFRLEERRYTKSEFVELMITWCEKYPVISIEDPAADTDWESWRNIYQAVGHRVQIVGDDLFTTNLQRIRQGIEQGLANSVLIKLNQIGTVTETLQAIQLTQSVGWQPIVSARSGETEDAFISHLAVATNAGQLKVGSFARSERMVKWNEVLRIERLLGGVAQFKGAEIFSAS